MWLPILYSLDARVRTQKSRAQTILSKRTGISPQYLHWMFNSLLSNNFSSRRPNTLLWPPGILALIPTYPHTNIQVWIFLMVFTILSGDSRTVRWALVRSPGHIDQCHIYSWRPFQDTLVWASILCGVLHS